MAIEFATTVLSWQENLSDGEMPPEWMWTLDHELSQWFENVEHDRKAKYGGSSDDEDAGPMMSNDLAKGRR